MMTKQISVFLSYKRIFTNGEKDSNENYKPYMLSQILNNDSEKKYNVFFNKTNISPSEKWKSEIFKRLRESDVLLIAVGPGTSESVWVQREIAAAIVLGISVVPIGYDLDDEQFISELKALGIDDIQGQVLEIEPGKDTYILKCVERFLENARKRTVKRQMELTECLMSRQQITNDKAKDIQEAYTTIARFWDNKINLHITSGDLFKTRGIDVLVNSENDYMQMALIFKRNTISSQLRRLGALINGKFRDTIQNELDQILFDRPRPVTPSTVYVTSSGGPYSSLAKVNKTRYIFHVAAIHVNIAESKMTPFKGDNEISDSVYNCLTELLKLNKKQGIVSPVGTKQREDQETIAQNGGGLSRSILFPLFGTGAGGRDAADVIVPMLDGFLHFFDDPDNSILAKDVEDIYFAAYNNPDVECVKQALAKM